MKVTNGAVASRNRDGFNALFTEGLVMDKVVSASQKGESSDTLWGRKENEEKTQATVLTTKKAITSEKANNKKGTKASKHQHLYVLRYHEKSYRPYCYICLLIPPITPQKYCI